MDHRPVSLSAARAAIASYDAAARRLSITTERDPLGVPIPIESLLRPYRPHPAAISRRRRALAARRRLSL